ncbi:Ribokinase-like protein [Atractiella rhizophila]|nr:Ribokinase-like protein [Atractiella rhizophila]
MENLPRVLTIAGSDSGGGAGIQADLKTFTAFQCYGSSVITALTSQNTHGVDGVVGVEAAFVAQQLKAVLSDVGADAVKLGTSGILLLFFF